MTFTIHKEAPKDKLVTMGKADKELEMTKEKEPVADYYPPGTTEPIVRPDNVPDPAAKTGVDVVSEEPADKQGPVGAKGEPKEEPKTKPVGKKK